MILGLKIGRRLIAACAIHNETFTFHDSRYVGAKATLATAIPAYLQQLIAQVHPRVIYVYAPSTPDSSTEQLVRLLEAEAANSAVSVKTLQKSDVIGSFGLVPLRTRTELRDQVLHLWPELAHEREPRQVPLAEAAAAALIGDLREEWPPV